jgi:hypothetical protein
MQTLVHRVCRAAAAVHHPISMRTSSPVPHCCSCAVQGQPGVVALVDTWCTRLVSRWIALALRAHDM